MPSLLLGRLSGRGQGAADEVEGTSRAGARPSETLQESGNDSADACGVALVNAVPPEASDHADRRRLEQMLLNLVDNAVKFSRRLTAHFAADRHLFMKPSGE